MRMINNATSSSIFTKAHIPDTYIQKNVLLVEGKTDIEFLTIMLDKPPFREENLFLNWEMIQCGGKDGVLKQLQKHPHYLGMVDRDAWDEEEIEKVFQSHPNLFILPRFCIENYIISPKELVTSFPKLKPEFNELTDEIATGIRHGCLWRAAAPLYQDLLHAGFNQALLKYPPVTDGELARLISNWQNILSVEEVTLRAQKFYKQVENLPQEEALKIFVHGKTFWRSVVERKMEKIFPGIKKEQLRKKVLREITMPLDLEGFLQNIFYSNHHIKDEK